MAFRCEPAHNSRALGGAYQLWIGEPVRKRKRRVDNSEQTFEAVHRLLQVVLELRNAAAEVLVRMRVRAQVDQATVLHFSTLGQSQWSPDFFRHATGNWLRPSVKRKRFLAI